MITKGSVIRLHGSGLYEVGNFRFDINDDSGNYTALVDLKDLEKGSTQSESVAMILELIKMGKVYLHSEEEFYNKLHEARRNAQQRREEERRLNDASASGAAPDRSFKVPNY